MAGIRSISCTSRLCFRSNQSPAVCGVILVGGVFSASNILAVMDAGAKKPRVGSLESVDVQVIGQLSWRQK